MFDKYHQAVRYLESINSLPKSDYMQTSFRNEFYLYRMGELIKKLKIDLTQFKYIHIGGTAGKGTTTAMVHQILSKAGKRVGSYYSPHPTTSIERIKMGEKFIPPDEFAILMDKIKPIIDKMYLHSKYGAPSYFEIFFAIALLYFTNRKCEYVILEVGCGGEFDATNIIPTPKICAITNIGYDHTHLLGKTLTKIAKTKAGIIKPNSLFLTSEQRPHLIRIFKQICKNKKCQFEQTLRTQTKKNLNAELAAAVASKLDIPDKYIRRGIKDTHISCRFEVIQKKPQIVLDGAHNYDKLNLTLSKTNNMQYKKLFLIFTLNENKQIDQIIKMMAYKMPTESEIYITRHLIESRLCANLEAMQKLFNKYGTAKKQIKILTDPWQALHRVLVRAKKNDLILITGSFYLAGELRKYWISEHKILSANI